jgi:hypothetical protein
MLGGVMLAYRFLACAALGASLVGLTGALALAAFGDDPLEEPAATASVSPLTDNVARLDMRFEQEGGPESGQIRVILTPTERTLTLLEARTAAEKAFVEALNEPGLGDTLTRIRIVVKLEPLSDKSETERSYLFELRLPPGRKSFGNLPEARDRGRPSRPADRVWPGWSRRGRKRHRARCLHSG